PHNTCYFILYLDVINHQEFSPFLYYSIYLTILYILKSHLHTKKGSLTLILKKNGIQINYERNES
ncbi:MAG: hypothetical protein ACFFFH_15980, partial [Candidatus Thorarchaeota archaeon]